MLLTSSIKFVVLSNFAGAGTFKCLFLFPLRIGVKVPAASLFAVKSKSIKEKNIKNEIVKYQISINVGVKIYTMTNKNIKNFNVNQNGDYNVANQHSQTIDNEKKLIELLSESLADNILEELIFRFYD